MSDFKRNEPYLSDEALERLIAQVEAEPALLHPPGEFKNDIIRQIHLKKKRKKNVELFSYSLKVFAAAAAALMIVLIVPESVRPEESVGQGQTWSIQKEQDPSKQTVPDRSKLYQESFGSALSRWMDDYCSKINTKLNEFAGMEVSIDYEKEEK